MIDDLKFKNPFTCITSVRSGSGKSFFCIMLCRISTHCVPNQASTKV
jgi:hypothetical protein